MALRVSDEFRTNPQSLKPGGHTVFTRDTRGRVLSYDKVKNPWAYSRKVRREDPEIIEVWWT
jgi:hypothetical protein